jgi:uncharacterized protein involved in exopolysaccharide biosynthesis
MVIALTLLGGLLLGGSARLAPPSYRAHVQLGTSFGPPATPARPGASAKPSTPSTSAATVAAAMRTNRLLIESRVRSYALLANSTRVLAPIVTTLRLPYSAGELAGRVAASVPLDSTIIDIYVTDTDPVRAGTVLEAIVAGLSGIADAEPHTAAPASYLRIFVRDPVSLPFRPALNLWPLHLLAGLVAGFAFGVGLATLRVLLAQRRPTATTSPAPTAVATPAPDPDPDPTAGPADRSVPTG